jgi:mannosyltransferase
MTVEELIGTVERPAASTPPITSASASPTAGRRRTRLRFARSLAARAGIVGVVAAGVGYAGAGIPSYWGDEAASVMSAERSWSSLALELGRIDAVHGLYYALLHAWIDVFGAGEWSTRAPSAIAVGMVAAGTVVLATRWFDARVGLVAGIVVALLPRTTAMAIEARSYALGAALAVWLTVACTELIRRRVASAWWWVGYGAGLALSTTLFVYLLLLVPVHLAALAVSRAPRGTWLRWGLGAAVAVVGSWPIVAAASAQRHQLRFLAERDYASADGVIVRQWFESPPVAVVAWTLVVVGIVATIAAVRRGRRFPVGFVPSLAWIAVPTAALLLADAFIAPTYSPRYLSFAVPAVARLVAVGVASTITALEHVVGGRAARAADRVDGSRGVGAAASARLLAGVVAGALALSVLVPVYLHQRTEWAKDGGSDLRAVAEYVQQHARPGDAIVFDRTTKPSRRPRLALHLYPRAFEGLRDVALRTPYDERAGIWDTTWPVALVAPALDERTVWALELPSAPPDAASAVPDDVRALEESGYRVVDAHLVHRTVVYRLEKG